MHQSLSLDVSTKGSQTPCCGGDADIYPHDRPGPAGSVNRYPFLVFFSTVCVRFSSFSVVQDDSCGERISVRRGMVSQGERARKRVRERSWAERGNVDR